MEGIHPLGRTSFSESVVNSKNYWILQGGIHDFRLISTWDSLAVADLQSQKWMNLELEMEGNVKTNYIYSTIVCVQDKPFIIATCEDTFQVHVLELQIKH